MQASKDLPSAAIYRSRRNKDSAFPAAPDLTIIRLARENSAWGYCRIDGELARLGITIAASTVWTTLKNAGIDPAPGWSSESWTAFLRAQAAIVACAGDIGPEARFGSRLPHG